MDTIRNYDPKKSSNFDYTHTVEVTVRCYEYSKTFIRKICGNKGGNLEGFNLFETAVDGIIDELGGPVEWGGNKPLIIVLTNSNGEALEVNLNDEPDIYPVYENFRNMVVSVKIVALESESDPKE